MRKTRASLLSDWLPGFGTSTSDRTFRWFCRRGYPNFCCIDAEIMCAAHANGARVLVVSGGVGGCNGGQVHNASVPCSAPGDLSEQPLVWFAAGLLTQGVPGVSPALTGVSPDPVDGP